MLVTGHTRIQTEILNSVSANQFRNGAAGKLSPTEMVKDKVIVREEALKAELEVAKAELARLQNVQPTPNKSMRYLKSSADTFLNSKLETECDPEADQLALLCEEREYEALTKQNKELRAELNKVKRRHA